MAKVEENPVFIGALGVFIVGLFQFIKTILNYAFDRRNALQKECDRLKDENSKLQIALADEKHRYSTEVTRLKAINAVYYSRARQKHALAIKYALLYTGAIKGVEYAESLRAKFQVRKLPKRP